jgi:hypothetical protein
VITAGGRFEVGEIIVVELVHRSCALVMRDQQVLAVI